MMNKETFRTSWANPLQNWLTSALFSVVLFYTLFRYAEVPSIPLVFATLLSIPLVALFRLGYRYWKITFPVVGVLCLLVVFQALTGQDFLLPLLSRQFWWNQAENVRAVVQWWLAPQAGAMPSDVPLYTIVATSFLATSTLWALPIPILNMALLILPYFSMKNLERDMVWVLFLLLGLYCVYSSYAYRQDPSEREQRAPVLFGLLLISATFLLQLLIGPEFFFNPSLSRRLNDLTPTEGGEVSPFSLEDLGFYPMGRSRIGGSVTLTDTPLLDIQAPADSFYLKGTSYDHFNGRAWGFSQSQTLRAFQSTQAYADDFSRPQSQLFWFSDASARDALLKAQIFHPALFSMRSRQPQRTVFHGGKPSLVAQSDIPAGFSNFADFAGAAIAQSNDFFFSPNGMLIARVAYNANPVTVQDAVFPITRTAFSAEDAQRWNEWLPVQRTAEAPRRYEALVTAYDPELADLLYREDPLPFGDLILAMSQHFNNLYQYSLTVSDIPEGETALSHFLQTKTGYCVYFATAWAALLQDIGYPAHYVEGFVVPAAEAASAPDSGILRTLTVAQGHAWVEVLTEGSGWVPLETTPSAHVATLANLTEGESAPPASPAVEESVSEASEPTASEESVSELASQESPAPLKSERPPLPWHLLGLLGLLLAVFLLWCFACLQRWKRSLQETTLQEAYRCAKKPDRRRLARYEWTRLCALWSALWPITPEDTVQTLFQKAALPEEVDRVLVDAVQALQYGQSVPSEANFTRLLHVRVQTELAVRSSLPRWKWWLQYVLPLGRPSAGMRNLERRKS